MGVQAKLIFVFQSTMLWYWSQDLVVMPTNRWLWYPALLLGLHCASWQRLAHSLNRVNHNAFENKIYSQRTNLDVINPFAIVGERVVGGCLRHKQNRFKSHFSFCSKVDLCHGVRAFLGDRLVEGIVLLFWNICRPVEEQQLEIWTSYSNGNI